MFAFGGRCCRASAITCLGEPTAPIQRAAMLRPRCGTRASVAVFLLLALCANALPGCRASEWPTPEDTSREAVLARWATQNGAQLSGFSIGQECDTCLRGVIATKDLEPGFVLQRIPLKLGVIFQNDQPVVAAEHARELLERMHHEPGFNDSFGVFWDTHPNEDEVFTPEVYTDTHLEMLQTPELESMALEQRRSTEAVYRGELGRDSRPFSERVPGVSLDAFKHVSSLLMSRMFGVEVDGREAAALLPVADFFNHNDVNPNAWRTFNATHMQVEVVLPIKAGQAITFNYYQDVIHRPDMSLFFFGFVEEREPPLLAAVDLPSFDASNAYAPTAEDDSAYEDPSSGYVTREEYQRLAERLAACPTTLEQDQKLLDSGMVTDWRLKTLLQYRVARKAALKLAMDRIAGQLGGHDGLQADAADDWAGEDAEL